MIAFICVHKPRSYNAKRKSRYQEKLRAAYIEFNEKERLNEVPLYGSVYYFHNEPTSLDADNLSKPVWDALKGLLYSDDSRIRLRHAGIVDLRVVGYESLDLSRLPDMVADRLIAALGSEPHILYIEIGHIEPKMFEFGRS